jgi:hypothetical protein
MSYNIKINHTKNDVSNKIIACIEQNYNHLHEWLLETEEIEDIFKESFYHFFYEYMDDSIEEHINLMASNFHLIIIAYFASHNNILLNTLKRFIKISIDLMFQKNSIWSNGLKYNIDDALTNHAD